MRTTLTQPQPWRSAKSRGSLRPTPANHPEPWIAPHARAATPAKATHSWGSYWCLGIVLLAVIFLLARLGGSGLLGFLIGMFIGRRGRRRLGWAAAVVAEEETAVVSVVLAGEAPEAAVLRAIGRLLEVKRRRNLE